jgi:integrase/recombinase XerD
MSDKSISPLRQRLIDDMTARRYGEKAQKAYVRHVRTFTAFLGRSPDTATKEDLRGFQLHLAQQPISAGSINAAIAALRFFFNVTLERPEIVRPLRTVNKPRRAPVVLSQEEVARLLEAAPSLKYKAALSVAYGAGLRVSEVANLKVSDIDSGRMMLRVEQGKGQRDRYGMLSPQLLELLRDWWRAARPPVWRFPGQNPINPITPVSSTAPSPPPRIWRASPSACRRIPPGSQARGFATHLLEQGVDIRVIQVLLGHAKLETTALYTRVAVNTVRDIKSPLERLGVNLASRSPPA